MNKLFEKIHATLPIFAIEHKYYHIIYTPGYYSLFENKNVEVLKNYFSDINTCKEPETQKVICDFITRAQQNLVRWKKQKSSPFIPECLTLHAGSECNLNCEYCYSKISGHNAKNGFPDIKKVKTAFKYLIANKKQEQKQVSIVYHGSGEPTYHWHNLIATHTWISDYAKQHSIKVFSYIATNGYLSPDKVKWLAKNMSLIGISCDGPADIQNKQRTNYATQLPSLEKTCQIIRQEKGQFNIRATITPSTVTKQTELASYFINQLGAKAIRFEPVYLSKSGFKPKQALLFYEHFKNAQNFAFNNNASLDYAGVRIDELHNSYCEHHRNTIRLTPNGILSNCFCNFTAFEGFSLGNIENESSNISDITKPQTELPLNCLNCINIMHCSRGCPDFCYFEPESKLNKFKCNLHQLIAVNQIKTLAENN